MGRKRHRWRKCEPRHDCSVLDESGSSHIHGPAAIASGGQRDVDASSNAEPSQVATASVVHGVHFHFDFAAKLGASGRAQANLYGATPKRDQYKCHLERAGNRRRKYDRGQICVTASNPCQTFSSGAAGSVDYLRPRRCPRRIP